MIYVGLSVDVDADEIGPGAKMTNGTEAEVVADVKIEKELTAV